jgi:hypothetical protein
MLQILRNIGLIVIFFNIVIVTFLIAVAIVPGFVMG